MKVKTQVNGPVPPLKLAVNVTGCPAVIVDGEDVNEMSCNGEVCSWPTFTEAVAVADWPPVSDPVTLIVFVPGLLKVVVNVGVFPPVDGLPPLAVQVKVNEPCPPVPLTVHSTCWPTVLLSGHVRVKTIGWAGDATWTCSVSLSCWFAMSVAVAVISCVPVVPKLVTKVPPVPVDGVPPVADQWIVTGD